MFWKNNNLEISVFESWVVMLRTGKIALNTFKNIHLQSNIFYSSKEGTGWWQGGCDASNLIGSGWLAWVPVSGTRSWQASGLQTSLPGHSAFDLLLTKGKEGWFYLQTVKSNLCWVHLEADPAVGAGVRDAEGRGSTHCEKNPSSVLPQRVPFLLSNFSAFDFLQGKILAASLTKIPISFYKRTLSSSPKRLVWNSLCITKGKTASHILLLLSTDGSEEHSLVSQWCLLFQEAQGDGALLPRSDELL